MKFASVEDVNEGICGNCGIKAIELKKLYDMKLNIPHFFVVTQEFFDAVIETNDAKIKLEFLTTKLKSEASKGVLEQLSALVSQLRIPEPLVDELYKRYYKLGFDSGAVKSAFDLIRQQREVFVAVRCSDSNPFLDTYTNIRGRDELIRAIKLCWASLFNEKAADFRQKNITSGTMAIIVQKMILTEKAIEVDVLDVGLLRVRGYWGQTGFLSQLNPDIYFVITSNYSVSSKTLGLQRDMFLLDKGKESFVKKSVPPEARGSQVFEDEEIAEITKITENIRKNLGDVSVEFGVSEGRLYVVNVRKRLPNIKEANVNMPIQPATSVNITLPPTGPVNTPIQPAASVNITLPPTGPVNTPIQPAASVNTPIQPAASVNTPIQPAASVNITLPPTGPVNTPIQPAALGNTSTPTPMREFLATAPSEMPLQRDFPSLVQQEINETENIEDSAIFEKTSPLEISGNETEEENSIEITSGEGSFLESINPGKYEESGDFIGRKIIEIPEHKSQEDVLIDNRNILDAIELVFKKYEVINPKLSEVLDLLKIDLIDSVTGKNDAWKAPKQ